MERFSANIKKKSQIIYKLPISMNSFAVQTHAEYTEQRALLPPLKTSIKQNISLEQQFRYKLWTAKLTSKA